MRRMTKLLLLAATLLQQTPSFGQIGTYFVPPMPYAGREPPGQAVGGASVALPALLPTALSNPAAMADLLRPVVAVSVETGRTSLRFREKTTHFKADPTFAEGVLPSYLGIAAPVRLWAAPFVVTASYDGPVLLEFDGAHSAGEVRVETEGKAKSASLAVAAPLSPQLAVGAGVTSWWGTTTWELAHATGSIGRLRQDYGHLGTHLGMQIRSRHLAAGLVCHMPHPFAEGRGFAQMQWPTEGIVFRQDFPGAVDFGLAWREQGRWMVSGGCMLQAGPTFHARAGSWQWEEKASGSGRLSFGGQYHFVLDNVIVPAYIYYGISRMPKAQGIGTLEFLQMTRSGDDLLVHELTLGAAAMLTRWSLHLVAQWQRSSFLVHELLEFPPPS